MTFNFLKVFFAMSIPFGIFVGWLFSLDSDKYFGIFAGLFAGVFGGGFITIFQKITGYTTDVHVSKNVNLDLPFNKAFDKAVGSIAEIGAKLKIDDKNSGYIKASGPMDLFSWGQSIEIYLSKNGESKTAIRVSSKPRLFLQITDKGENTLNVDRIVDYLNN